jgi:ubiquinone/menaquinone biosynthesis C-methylase UbiE
MKNADEINRLRELYTFQYPPMGTDINYIWHPRNPIAIYYRQAQERSIVSMFNSLGLALGNSKVLDVGCGSGSILRFFSSIGGNPACMYGVDLIPERLFVAQRIGPISLNYAVCNAQFLPFQDASFDISCMFTVLASIFDHDVRKDIAQEITRVIKDEGYLICYDMYHSKSINTLAISASEIETLFPDFQPVYRIKLHSPWISRLAKRSYLLCDIIDHLPFLRKTHNLYMLRKIVG